MEAGGSYRIKVHKKSRHRRFPAPRFLLLPFFSQVPSCACRPPPRRRCRPPGNHGPPVPPHRQWCCTPGLHTSSFKSSGCLPDWSTSARAAAKHLRGVADSLAPGQAALHASVRQRLDKEIRIGRPAAGHGAGRINEVLRQLVQHARRAHQSPEGVPAPPRLRGHWRRRESVPPPRYRGCWA